MFPVRTRIAPSPTGDDLHIGNAYTALINYVFAKKNGGQFIVRIEDTDRSRLVEGSEARILASLRWLGIIPDEGPDVGGQHAPYRQSERLGTYKQLAEELVAAGHAYYCFCTPARLEEMRKHQEENHQPPMYDGRCKALSTDEVLARLSAGEKHVIRLAVPDTGETVFTDLIRGEIRFENALIDDQVLLKSDGFPTYHLGVVVDDHLMKISHIIRGEEWISSTPKHILLYDFFGWEKPVFAHMPLLRNPDKSKLSKRKNPVWVAWFRKQGFLPGAIRNYLALLAWAYPDGRDIFSTEEMISQFDLAGIQTTAPIFDLERLRWLNGEYLRTMDSSTAVSTIVTFFGSRYPAHQVERILPLVLPRMKTLSEFSSLVGFLFEKPGLPSRPIRPDLAAVAGRALADCEWNHAAMEQALRAAAQEEEIPAKELFMELRLAVTGSTVGPPLLESLEILGREETLARLS